MIPLDLQVQSLCQKLQSKSTECNSSPTNQMPMEETVSAVNIPESLKTDTGHPLQWQTVPKSTSQQGIDQDANRQQDQLQDQDEQDTIVHNADVLHDDDDQIAIDPISHGTSIQLE